MSRSAYPCTKSREPTYRVVLERNPVARVVIPPPKNAVISKDPDGVLAQRNEHIRMRGVLGKTEWREETGFGLRNYAETGFARYKQIIGGKLRARKFERQRTEAMLGCRELNKIDIARHAGFGPGVMILGRQGRYPA